jgi:hypothetical protein
MVTSRSPIRKTAARWAATSISAINIDIRQAELTKHLRLLHAARQP